MPSYVPPKKNNANGYVTYVSLPSQANMKIMQANPTLAAGDVKRAIDDAAPANLATLPVVDADFTTRVKVVLSQAEINGDNITVVFKDVAGDEWCDLTINIQTGAQTLDELDIVADGIQTDLSNATDGLGALKILLDAIPTTAMRGTDNAALAASWTAALATVLGNYTAARAGYLDELAAANLPTDITNLLGYCDILDHATNGLANIKSLIDAIGNIVTAIKLITDALPNAGALDNLATLAARLSAARAGYLDNLSAGAVALEATLTAIKGAGWTNETLKMIKEFVDELESGDKPTKKAEFHVR